MKSHKIEFKFTKMVFDYSLPLTGVDLAFINARKVEIQYCMAQLADRVKYINIASSKGVADFETASKLVKYYWYAMCVVKRKESSLLGYKYELTDEQKEKFAVRMYEQTRERTK